jgi:hypothetical protein
MDDLETIRPYSRHAIQCSIARDERLLILCKLAYVFTEMWRDADNVTGSQGEQLLVKNPLFKNGLALSVARSQSTRKMNK